MTLQEINDRVATALTPMLAEQTREAYRAGKRMGLIIGSLITGVILVAVSSVLYAFGL